MTTRRETLAAGLAIAMAALGGAPARAGQDGKGLDKPGFGLIGQIKAVAGKRDELLAALRDGTDAMPGNIAYIIGADMADGDAIWITELWTTRAAHEASLQLPAVQAAIRKARPLIAGFGTRAEFLPT